MNNTQARRIADPHNPEPDFITTAPIIEGIEKLGDWIEHREIVVQELCPVGALETLYAQRAALYLWRLKRVIGFENAAMLGGIDARSEILLEDSQESRVNRDSPDQPTLQTIFKYEAHLHRCLAVTMAELRRLQKERRQGLRSIDEIDETSARSAPLEHGETASEQVISREGEPPCEPVFKNINPQPTARSTPRDPEESISGRAILREGEPPCEPVFTKKNSQSSARTTPRPPDENTITETPARTTPRPPGFNISGLVI